jgi:hypothetical protein
VGGSFDGFYVIFDGFCISLSLTCWGWGAGELIVLVASAQDEYQEQNT